MPAILLSICDIFTVSSPTTMHSPTQLFISHNYQIQQLVKLHFAVTFQMLLSYTVSQHLKMLHHGATLFYNIITYVCNIMGK